MARIFTIQFSYENETYNTIVSVKTTQLYNEYTLVNLDTDLLPLLPGNKLISTADNNLLFPDAGTENSSVLMNSIIKAVRKHLQSVTGTLSSGEDK